MQIPRMVRQAVGGIYAWIATIYFGTVLLDVVYSHLLGISEGPAVRVASTEVSDFLLLLAGITLFTGILAIGLTWTTSAARNLFAVSLLVIVVYGILAFLVLFPLSRTSPDSVVLDYAPLFRLAPVGLASLIGLLGSRSLYTV